VSFSSLLDGPHGTRPEESKAGKYEYSETYQDRDGAEETWDRQLATCDVYLGLEGPHDGLHGS
jgi:hypothetical protein